MINAPLRSMMVIQFNWFLCGLEGECFALNSRGILFHYSQSKAELAVFHCSSIAPDTLSSVIASLIISVIYLFNLGTKLYLTK